jgi:hypothetical protein
MSVDSYDTSSLRLPARRLRMMGIRKRQHSGIGKGPMTPKMVERILFHRA